MAEPTRLEPTGLEPIRLEAGAARPRKRSVLIAGHATSVSMEDGFWRALARLAEARGQSVNALVAEIDQARTADPDTPNLSGAVRVWILGQVSR